MRGFHRAVKRNEKWALKIWALKDINPLGYLLALLYRNVDFKALVYSKNPFLDLVYKPDNWTGKYHTVPLVFGKETDDESS